MPRRVFAAPRVRVDVLTPPSLFRLGMRAAICFSLPLRRPCSFRTYIKSDRNTDFLALLISAMSVLWKSWLEDCSQGKEEREGHNLWDQWGLSGSHAATARVWMSLCSVTASWDSCISLVMGFRDGSHNPGIYTPMLMKSNFAVCFICSSCILNSNAEQNTMVFEQYNSQVPAKSTLYLLWLWCSSLYLVWTYAKKNAPIWSPW